MKILFCTGSYGSVKESYKSVWKLYESVWDHIQESYKSVRLLNLNPRFRNYF